MPDLEVPCYVDGNWIKTKTTHPMRDPYHNSEIGTIYLASSNLVDRAVQSSYVAKKQMADMPAYERSSILRRVATRLKDRREELAKAMAIETGKALKECLGEIERSVSTLELTAEEAVRVLTEVIPLDAVPNGVGKLGFTLRFPIGIIAVITPFNAPVNLACHKIGPALAAGNVVVFKPPLEASFVSKLLVEVFLEGGVPPQAIQMVNGAGETGNALVSHTQVDLINFTGSGKTALRIMNAAGLKRTLFELGGNGATIIHCDANLDHATGELVKAAFGLAGQSCVSTQRVYVHRSLYDQFVDYIAQQTNALKIGDPLDPTTDVGTMITEEAAIRVQSWIEEAVNEGAKLMTGGKRDGAIIQPTILVGANPKSRVVCEEVFGPTLAIIPYDDFQEAIWALNDSPWGLQTGIFTSSLDIALQAMRQMRAGGININGPSRGRTDIQPFGGVKESGWGREGPKYAILEMTELRMITITPSNISWNCDDNFLAGQIR